MTIRDRARTTAEEAYLPNLSLDAREQLIDRIEQAITAAVEAEREACASLAEEACLDIGASAMEAEGVGRRTRDAIAAAIRARPAEEKAK